MKKSFFILLPLLIIFILSLAFIIPFVRSLDSTITSRFEGKRWKLPARIYARPLEFYVGQSLNFKDIESELSQVGYSKEKDIKKPGEYNLTNTLLNLHTRQFQYPDTLEKATLYKISLNNKTIEKIHDLTNNQPRSHFRLDPKLFASIYPTHNEDRILIRLRETPDIFIKTLLLAEDKTFFDHKGIKPTAILRAFIANVKAGKTVQGGSTLTQQLVKNFFLSSEKSLQRKIKEAVMSLILEFHYNKEEILETYLNEVFLGQDGARAIHGFGLASKYYFGKDLTSLELSQYALLVSLSKGASYYNPRTHSNRAMQRRNHILEKLAQTYPEHKQEVEEAKTLPLQIVKNRPSGITPFPAFLQLVRKQLANNYKDEDLQNEGLRVFTTLDPVIQLAAEKSVHRNLINIEKNKTNLKKGSLQAAVIISNVDNGEVLAIVGDRKTNRAGYNRVLDMKRPIGSIIKPAIFLTALAKTDSYNLLTFIDDSPIQVRLESGELWHPENYDHSHYGPQTLLTALTRSSNLATVRLGLNLGIDNVLTTLNKLGIKQNLPPYPSLLLGAVELTPFDVAQMYQTIGGGGFRTPLRAIVAVVDQSNTTLHHYPLTVEQTIDSNATYCLSEALHHVTTHGTANSLSTLLPESLRVAGKTGTTNNYRDSWFGGFTGGHVIVTWVGRDDNKPTNLTGASGGLKVWAEIVANIQTSPLQMAIPDNTIFYYGDTSDGTIYSEKCTDNLLLLPFIKDAILPESGNCLRSRRATMRPKRINR